MSALSAVNGDTELDLGPRATLQRDGPASCSCNQRCKPAYLAIRPFTKSKACISTYACVTPLATATLYSSAAGVECAGVLAMPQCTCKKNSVEITCNK